MWKDFGEVHERIYNWVDKGFLKFPGNKSRNEYTELNSFILKSFDFPGNETFESVFLKLMNLI